MESSPNQATKPKVGSAFDLPAKSWNIVKKHWQLFAFVNAITILGALGSILSPNSYLATMGGRVPEAISTDEIMSNAGVILISGVAFLLASTFFYVMAMVLALRTIDDQPSTPSQLFSIGSKFWLREIGLFIVVGLIILVGLILFIVPGIFAIIRLYMSSYILIDRDLGIIESIKASNQLAKDNMGPVTAVIGVYILISIALGLLEIIPVFGIIVSTVAAIGFSLIVALRYRELTSATNTITS